MWAITGLAGGGGGGPSRLGADKKPLAAWSTQMPSYANEPGGPLSAGTLGARRADTDARRP